MNKNAMFGILAGIVTAVIITLISSSSMAQMGGHDMGSKDSSMGGYPGGSSTNV